MTEADVYESLPSTVSLKVSALAGSIAGIAEHCVMYPVDSVKTRMQSLACSREHSTMYTVMSTMIREEGFLRPCKGVSVMAAGAGPAHALYFTALEKSHEYLERRTNVPRHFVSGLSAVSATLLHDAIMTPAEVVKQRLQMCCSPFTSATTAATTIFKEEGFRAFYRSYLTQLTMNVPFQAAVVTSYTVFQNLLNPQKEYNPKIHFLAGAVAGGVACFVTMPLDVCKTLLNTQEAAVLTKIGQTKVVGLKNAARVVYNVGGFKGFYQGLTARVLYQAPSTAVAWSVYESFKYLLKTSNYEGSSDGKYNTIASAAELAKERQALKAATTST